MMMTDKIKDYSDEPILYYINTYPIQRTLSVLPGKCYLDIFGNVILISNTLEFITLIKSPLQIEEEVINLTKRQFNLLNKIIKVAIKKMMNG